MVGVTAVEAAATGALISVPYLTKTYHQAPLLATE